jgi:iron complex transport system permease protein
MFCIVTIVVFVLITTLSPFIGAYSLEYSKLLNYTTIDSQIFWQMRIPRLLHSLVTGAGLSLCGISLQAIFRNDLVSPFTLGISGAATAGVYFCAGSCSIASGALQGGLFCAILLGFFLFTSLSGATLLLVGMSLNFFFSGLVILFQYLSDIGELVRATRWLFGSLESSTMADLIPLASIVLFGLLIILYYANSLDLLSIGEDFARSRGIFVRGVQAIIILTTSIVTSVTVAYHGPITFVGVIIPHMIKKITTTTHVGIAIYGALWGGIFLVFADCLSRIIVKPYEVPIGVMTALLGVPLFLIVIWYRKE